MTQTQILLALVVEGERQHESQEETDCENCHDHWLTFVQCGELQFHFLHTEFLQKGLNCSCL